MKAYKLRILAKEYEVDNVDTIIGIIQNSIGEVFAKATDHFYTYYQSNDDVLCCAVDLESTDLYIKLFLINPDEEEFIVGYTNCPIADTIPSKNVLFHGCGQLDIL